MNQSSTNPAGQGTPPAVFSTDAEGATAQLHEASPRILVAVQDANMREVIRRAITEIGLKAVCVSSLREARDILDRGGVSLVICLARLRDGTFHELLPAVHSKGAGMVVVCAGACSSGARIDALELGIMDYVSYPLHAEELQWVVRVALAKSLSGEAKGAGLR